MRQHARERALQRYGLELNREDLDNIVKLIQGHNGQFVERLTNDRKLWRVCYKGVWLNCVFSKRNKTLVTILPADASPQLNSPGD